MLAPLKLTEVEKQIVHDEMAVHKVATKFFKPFEHDPEKIVARCGSVLCVGWVIFLAMLVAPIGGLIVMAIVAGSLITLTGIVRALYCWGVYRHSAAEWRDNFYEVSSSRTLTRLHGGKVSHDGTITVHGFVIPFDLRSRWAKVSNCTRIPAVTKDQIAAECGRLTLALRELPDADKLSDDEREVIQTSLSRQFAELGRAVDGAVAFEKNGTDLDQKVLAQRKVQEADALNKYLAAGNKLPMTEIADALESCNSQLTGAAKNIKSLP